MNAATLKVASATLAEMMWPAVVAVVVAVVLVFAAAIVGAVLQRRKASGSEVKK